MTYHIRVYCEEDSQYYRTTQTTIDESWVPSGHESHTIRDFVIEHEIE